MMADGANNRKWKGALVSENALHIDGDKPNSVSGLLRTMIIYLVQLAPNARGPSRGQRPPRQFRVMRRTRGFNGPAALPLFCLAPHGVFPASRLAARAVSSYLAFSPLPNERLRTR